jgi:hypothetical protein
VPRRILVLEKQANLIETQALRVNKALKKEGEMEGHLTPEIRANIELLDRLLHRHFVTQQDLGLEPKLAPAARDPKGDGGGAPDSAVNQALKELVNRVHDLPDAEFLPAMVALIGPPPVKQPLVLDPNEVIEFGRRTPPEAADGSADGSGGVPEP